MSSRGVMSANLGLPPPLDYFILLLLQSLLFSTLFAGRGVTIFRKVDLSEVVESECATTDVTLLGDIAHSR